MYTEVEENIKFAAGTWHAPLRMDLNQSEHFNSKKFKFDILL